MVELGRLCLKILPLEAAYIAFPCTVMVPFLLQAWIRGRVGCASPDDDRFVQARSMQRQTPSNDDSQKKKPGAHVGEWS